MNQNLTGRGIAWTGGSFEWLADMGILSSNVIAAHAQNIRPGEAALIAQAGARIALVFSKGQE